MAHDMHTLESLNCRSGGAGVPEGFLLPWGSPLVVTLGLFLAFSLRMRVFVSRLQQLNLLVYRVNWELICNQHAYYLFPDYVRCLCARKSPLSRRKRRLAKRQKENNEKKGFSFHLCGTCKKEHTRKADAVDKH